MNTDVEIEIKLPIQDKATLIKKLESLGATFVSKKQQTDLLFNAAFAHFEKEDKALRLRREQYEDGSQQTLLTFKGTPKHTEVGHKMRDEYETKVDFDQLYKILRAIGFTEEVIVKKVRETYALPDLDIAIDELAFGIFLEIEGQEADIEALREKLGLKNVKPVSKGYAHLQWDFEKRPA